MRPPSISLNLYALFTFPYRLCNPPPAAGNVRSCKVTPLLKISLEDVLNKRHLPPLTLKDFEEWLMFVEDCPQYLYFLLWFKEYETRYAAWLAESGYEVPAVLSPSKISSSSSVCSVTDLTTDSDYTYANLIPPSGSLALFFTRAKQTFLDPHSPYALGPDALTALMVAHTPSTHSFSPSIPKFTIPPPDAEMNVLPPELASQPHPHPRELAPLAQYVRLELKERLDRFATSACHNVGTRRAWCGVAGGIMITLVLGILPTLITLFWARARWWRLVGWLGCWIGGTIVISSFHGICMMIYVFGDLRQLRSFELARPVISSPRAIARARPRLRSFVTRTPDGTPEITENDYTTKETPRPSPASDAVFPRQGHVPRVYIPPPPQASRKKSDLTTSVSETSTGTPVVRFDPGEFLLSTASQSTSVDIDNSIGSESEGQGQTATEDEVDGFGIEISPAYYPNGMAPVTQVRGELTHSGVQQGLSALGSVHARVSRIFNLVLRNGRLSASGDVSARSHVGTFGVRSWRGGLGDSTERHDTEKSFMSDEEEEEEEQEMLTAGFIPNEYSIANERIEAQAKDMPVQFDFDKLPVRPPIPHPISVIEPPCGCMQPSQQSLVLPPTDPQQHAFPQLPKQKFPRPTPHLAPLKAALYSHPGASLPPAPASPITPTSPSLSPKSKERQWWDTCPRHPAVEARLTSKSVTIPNAASPPVLPTPRASSRASSKVYSRTHPLAKPHESSWSTRLRSVMAVPAFGPLTRVLSPVVSRGQWEIVVRSAIVAALGAWGIIGFIVALPHLH